MEWHGFIMGLVTAALAYATFSAADETDEEECDYTGHTGVGSDIEGVDIHDFSGRHVTLSCQTCRKLKRHKEVSPSLYQCVKCKRHVDLRAS